MKLSDVHAVVTGGASGLGAATVDRLRADGGAVVVVDRTPSDPSHVAADVADGPMMESVIEGLDRINVLVCCAGIGAGKATVGRSGVHDLETFERVLRVNTVGTFNPVRLAAARMIGNEPDPETGERGVIVLTASVAAFDGVDGGVAYSASKGAVTSMVLPLARDLGRYGIRVVAIAPGPMETPLVGTIPTAFKEQMASTMPFPKRFGYPTEFAALVSHIVANPLLNGEVIRLDGAMRMTPSSI
jgi:3-hydroxyacyl-CoA dehydrogenase / 3-hydroxy-2-methylbutyryl-CoA dehydrogenase